VSLYKTKHLVGGGVEVMENRLVDTALQRLGYTSDQRSQLLKYLATHQTLEGSALAEEHLDVFDCAIPSKGSRMLSLDAHLLMTAALQPFLSGAISKTMNVAHNTGVGQMSDAYIRAWKLGIKNITVYRDGCKGSQPLQTTATTGQGAKTTIEGGPVRRKLTDHQMNMHRVRIRFGSVKGYVLVTPYEDTGMPGELFVKLAKEGSTISGLVDGWAQAISYCLQYGVPLEALVEKFSNTKFEPSGFSKDADIRHATSIYDAIVRKLAAIFLNGKNGNGKTAQEIAQITETAQVSDRDSRMALDAPICDDCGTLMIRTGATCHSCPSCGGSSGCG
jgi:ribonucleoside-diphosphate reductase alpha chain